ncbi:hypothetical protein I553_3198 [Mycobacterium xenopi 4042]|uniref:Uncharacterized protein n=1 Tax=Mycobacterium xenopi 4042 TaxID=1299334 RepID=X8E536_MYCXE|nr:hypothetical protein I553_3198 [Mycobacterium xenopi 4042]
MLPRRLGPPSRRRRFARPRGDDFAVFRWRGRCFERFSISRAAWSRMHSRPYSKLVSSAAPRWWPLAVI